MPLVKDRVMETTSTAGTGTITLLGAKTGYRAFTSAFANADTLYYCITNGTAWEVGNGTFTTSGTTLSRTLMTSSTGSLLSLSGTYDVFCCEPADRLYNLGTTSINLNRASGSQSLTGINIDGSAGTATTATNLTGGNGTTLLGTIKYQSGTDTSTSLNPNTTATKNFLSQTGTGTNGAAPAWSVVSKTDVGLSAVENTALSTWTGATSITTVGTVTTGNVTNLTGGNGTTLLGAMHYQSGTNLSSVLNPNTSATKNFLSQTGTGANGAAPAWGVVSKTDVGLSAVENTALSTWGGSTNITTTGAITTGSIANMIGGNTTTLLGSLPYQSNTNTTTQLAPNVTTTKMFLNQTGTGSNGAAPAWAALVNADIPAALTGKTISGLTVSTTTGTFTLTNGKTLSVTNSLTFSGTDSSTLDIGAGGTLGSAAYTASGAYVPLNGALGTPTSGTLTNCTFPTLNQNTSGTSGGLTGTPAISVASAALNNGNLTGVRAFNWNGVTNNATTTGAVTVDWTTGNMQSQAEPTGAITYTFTAPAAPCHLQLYIDSDGTSTAQTFTWPGTVIWFGAVWAGANNKKAVINFFYDGTNYYAQGANQV